MKLHVFKEHWKRSLLKAVTYRILIVILDFSFVYFLTGRLEIALTFTVVSNLYASIAYYMHERLWNKVNWGKEKHIPRKRSN